MSASPSAQTVLADHKIPKSFLQQTIGGKSKHTRQGSSPHPSRSSSSDVYYFEIMILPGPSPSATFDITIGLLGADEDTSPVITSGVVPGETNNSIGWGASGLKINGRTFETNAISCFKSGDVLGCGIEVLGMQRVFFTLNGTLMVPPSPNTSFMGTTDLPCTPAVGFRNGPSNALKANFGLDPYIPFRWTGSDRLSIIPCHSSRTSLATTSSLPTTAVPTPTGFAYADSISDKPNPRATSSPFYPTAGLDQLDDPMLRGDPMASTNAGLTRSAQRHTNGPMYGSQSTHETTSSPRLYGTSAGIKTISNSGYVPPPAEVSTPPAYFGTKNTKKSLEDDDPADTNSATNAHFNLSSASSSHWSGSDASNLVLSPNSEQPRPPVRLLSRPEQAPISTPTPSTRREIGRERRRSRGRGSQSMMPVSTTPPVAVTQLASSASAAIPPSTSPTNNTSRSGLENRGSRDEEERMPPSRIQMDPPASSTDRLPFNPFPIKREETNTTVSSSAATAGSTASASGDNTLLAKENYKALLLAAGDRNVDHSYVRQLVEICKADQEKLQRKLSQALEESDVDANLEELFALNDGICSAIEAGEQALKRVAEPSSSRKKSLEGPTIELLVENEDIFSLICMLRAQNEKRLAAALALMKFARESEPLRDEIRSSGGMHSFLTLFRTNGMTRELQVVASLAVAYVLPSYVVLSSSVGLRIIECLRFLVTSRPVSPQGVSITREEMCKAAAMGVNILWINAVQPLIHAEVAKKESRTTRPTLRSTASRAGRSLRGRLDGGGLFDQGQDSIEIKELTEMSVTLITHIAKLTHCEGLQIDMGYNIVEQVCEVDVARPIAVREGLLKILVDWIRSKDVSRIRPAASALRYLISIEDKYMAGWIHSQVVNEGAVGEIVKLLNESVGHDVRVAVAQMLSALCVAPHTRAAVVEAKCVSYLVALLYEHNDPASQIMVQYAGSALVQLAAGAMTRASALTGNSLAIVDSATPDKQDSVVT